MRGVIRIGALLAALAAGISLSAQSPAPPDPISNEDVTHIFKIDNATGRLTPLERPQIGQHANSSMVWTRRWNSSEWYSGRDWTELDWDRNDSVWLKGATSSLAIRADDQPLRFAIRFGYVTKAWDKEMRAYQSKPLVVQEMKAQRDTRQQTKSIIPLQMTPFDSPSHAMSVAAKQDMTFQTFILSVPVRLTAGEYAIHPDNGVMGLAMGGEAFKVVE